MGFQIPDSNQLWNSKGHSLSSVAGIVDALGTIDAVAGTVGVLVAVVAST